MWASATLNSHVLLHKDEFQVWIQPNVCPEAHGGEMERWYGEFLVLFSMEIPARAGTGGQPETEKGNWVNGSLCAKAHLAFQNSLVLSSHC